MSDNQNEKQLTIRRCWKMAAAQEDLFERFGAAIKVTKGKLERR